MRSPSATASHARTHTTRRCSLRARPTRWPTRSANVASGSASAISWCSNRRWTHSRPSSNGFERPDPAPLGLQAERTTVLSRVVDELPEPQATVDGFTDPDQGELRLLVVRQPEV